MMSAMQSAKLQAAQKLTKAIEELSGSVSLICFNSNDSAQIRDVMSDIDTIRAKILPSNSGPKERDV
jgi:hypothetical protein